MRNEFSILVAEDCDGHFLLIEKNLYRLGFRNNIIRFVDGQQILDFLNMRAEDQNREPDKNYMILLDIRMPKVDGIEVLRQVKGDSELSRIPVVMLTTTDDQKAIDQCLEMGCSDYIVKPMNHADFVQAIHNVGLSLLLNVVELAHI